MPRPAWNNKRKLTCFKLGYKRAWDDAAPWHIQPRDHALGKHYDGPVSFNTQEKWFWHMGYRRYFFEAAILGRDGVVEP